MSGCCTTAGRKHSCPLNGKAYASVPDMTLLYHLKNIYRQTLKPQTYYFCDDSDCEAVYFAEDGSYLTQAELRTPIGQKDTSGSATVCYCFGIDRDTATHDPAAKQFVIDQTRQKNCACESFNPSGRCCLKDFPESGEA